MWGRSRLHGRLWEEARTLEDAADLTARWLEGELSYHPMNLAPGPDEETTHLVRVLAEVNRLGFVTDFSQPGVPYEGGWMQRASVGGLCREELVVRLQHLLLGTDLVVLALPPLCEDTLRLPVTVLQDVAHTWVGTPFGEDELELYASQGCSEELVEDLAGCWTLYVVDPVWGRDDVLWEHLLGALRSTEPVPDPSYAEA